MKENFILCVLESVVLCALGRPSWEFTVGQYFCPDGCVSRLQSLRFPYYFIVNNF
jgi:hypothetical protein